MTSAEARAAVLLKIVRRRGRVVLTPEFFVARKQLAGWSVEHCWEAIDALQEGGLINCTTEDDHVALEPDA